MAFIAAYVFSVFYTLNWNPEIKFWKFAAEKKLNSVRQLHKSDEAQDGIVLCYGGSTTSFGIDGGYATSELDFPMVNLGLHAGMGAEAVSGFALSQLEKGDTLLVMLEPHLIVRSDALTALGRQFAFGMGQPQWVTWRSNASATGEFVKSLPDLRPGALNIFSMGGKVVMRKPIYRYFNEDVRDGGLVVTEVRNRLKGRSGVPGKLPPHGVELLEAIARQAEMKGAKAIYCLPWAYFRKDVVPSVRANRISFLKDVEKIMPVVWEPELGIQTDPQDFGDTPQHLTEEAARARTIKLVNFLKAQK